MDVYYSVNLDNRLPRFSKYGGSFAREAVEAVNDGFYNLYRKAVEQEDTPET